MPGPDTFYCQHCGATWERGRGHECVGSRAADAKFAALFAPPATEEPGELDRLRAENDALKLRVGVLEKALAEVCEPPPSPQGRMRIWEGRHFHEPAWKAVPGPGHCDG